MKNSTTTTKPATDFLLSVENAELTVSFGGEAYSGETVRLAGADLSATALEGARAFWRIARDQIVEAYGEGVLAGVSIMRSSSVDFPEETGIDDRASLEAFIDAMFDLDGEAA